MKLKKTLSILAASVFAALVFTGTGVVNNGMNVVEAAGNSMIVAAAISGTNVNVTASATSAPASDDGLLYLFAEPIYSDGITTSALATAPAGANAAFVTTLDANTANSKLFSKFVVAAKQGGQFVKLNPGAYVTNPEALATHTFARTERGKKGIVPDPNKLGTNELDELGVKQVLYNIDVSRILGPTDNPNYPTINYSYNGKNYQMNGVVVAEYEYLFGTFTKKGIQTTAILLNPNDGRAPYLIHPLARNGFRCPYYLFNTAEPLGVESLAAASAFLAEHFSNDKVGKVDNWIVANEVNIMDEWNYAAISGVNNYAAEYAEGFRICYNAIKSKNANANVLICTDHQWDRNRGGEPGKFDGKDFIDAFDASVKAGGNIDWGYMTHPYPVPLTWAAYWTGGAYYKNLVKHSVNTAFISMENIEVVTDYFCRPELLSPRGTVRYIQTGCGYTATQGENYAVAALVLGYEAAKNNQYIKTFIVAKETDTADEIRQGLTLGLCNMDGTHKATYECYKNLDGAGEAAYINQALALRGASSLAQVIAVR